MAILTGFGRSVILSFLVAMGLLLAVTIFSKKLSAFGGGWRDEDRRHSFIRRNRMGRANIRWMAR